MEFVIGVMVGVLSHWLFQAVSDYWYRPKLEIGTDRPEVGQDWSVHAIVIKNTGRRAASHCRGALSLVREDTGTLDSSDTVSANDIIYLEEVGIDEGKFNHTGRELYLLSSTNFRVISGELAHWSRIGNPTLIDLYPRGDEAMLDVCRWMAQHDDKPAQIQIPTEGSWERMRIAIKATDRYQYLLTVTVFAENARLRTKTFRVMSEERGIKISPDSPR